MAGIIGRNNHSLNFGKFKISLGLDKLRISHTNPKQRILCYDISVQVQTRLKIVHEYLIGEFNLLYMYENTQYTVVLSSFCLTSHSHWL